MPNLQYLQLNLQVAEPPNYISVSVKMAAFFIVKGHKFKRVKFNPPYYTTLLHHNVSTTAPEFILLDPAWFVCGIPSKLQYPKVFSRSSRFLRSWDPYLWEIISSAPLTLRTQAISMRPQYRGIFLNFISPEWPPPAVRNCFLDKWDSFFLSTTTPSFAPHPPLISLSRHTVLNN